MATGHGRPWLVTLGALTLVAAIVALVLLERGDRPPRPAPGVPARELEKPDFLAQAAKLSQRIDERPSGLALRHETLELEGVSRPRAAGPAGVANVYVYTDVPELEARIGSIVDGEIPVDRRMPAMFAIGRLAPATIVRIDSSGIVREVQDVRPLFISVTQP